MFTRLHFILALVFASTIVGFPVIEPDEQASRRPKPRPKHPHTKSGKQPQVVMSCSEPNTAALTFDDGPSVYMDQVSDMLTAVGAKGTFFVNGNNYDCIYTKQVANRLKYAYSQGHQIASHTWSHPHLPSLTYDQIVNELTRINDAIESELGVLPAFMRPPYGEFDERVVEVAASLAQTVVVWDFDSEDSTQATPATSRAAYDRLATRHPPNVLALNHDTIETTVHEVLPHAIKTLQGAGYRLVTLAECLGRDAYQKVESTKGRTGKSSRQC